MKAFFKEILKYYLKYITKLALFIHRPIIIAVAGSTNKTFVRDEVKKVLLKAGKTVRANPKNFNTEIGLPLAVLGLKSGYNSFNDWLPIILKAPAKIFSRDFPEYLLLMLGTSDSGDIKHLMTIVKPQAVIITDITQRYLEGFSDLNELVGEYGYLVKKLPANGVAVLNNDNQRIKELGKLTKADTMYFGLGENPMFWAFDAKKTSRGQKVKIRDNEKKIIECAIDKFGQHHIYACMIGLIIKKYVSEQKL